MIVLIISISKLLNLFILLYDIWQFEEKDGEVFDFAVDSNDGDVIVVDSVNGDVIVVVDSVNGDVIVVVDSVNGDVIVIVDSVNGDVNVDVDIVDGRVTDDGEFKSLIKKLEFGFLDIHIPELNDWLGIIRLVKSVGMTVLFELLWFIE